MDKEQIKLEIVKSSLEGGLILENDELDRYFNWTTSNKNSRSINQRVTRINAGPGNAASVSVSSQNEPSSVTSKQPDDVQFTSDTETKEEYYENVDDILVGSGDFLEKMKKKYSPRVTTKCLTTFDTLGIKTIGELRNTSQLAILHTKNAGKQTVSAISGTLKEYGVTW